MISKLLKIYKKLLGMFLNAVCFDREACVKCLALLRVKADLIIAWCVPQREE